MALFVGAFVLDNRTAPVRALMLPLALILSACQTMDDGPITNTWSPASLGRPNNSQSRPERISGAALLDNVRGGQSTIIEGTGRFVGEPPTGSTRTSAEAGSDGVTLNLVNVPAPQVAKTVLGDILAVRYTIDPAIQGQITIQTPKPVAKSAVIDLFQSALRSNNAAIVNKDGMYRVVPIDQAALGANIRVDSSFGEQIGSGLQVVQLKYKRNPPI